MADSSSDDDSKSPPRGEALPKVDLVPYRGEEPIPANVPGFWLQEVFSLDRFLGGDHISNEQFTFTGQQLFKDANTAEVIVFWGGINKQVEMPSRSDYHTVEMINISTGMVFTQRHPQEYGSHWTYGGAGDEGLIWIMKCTNFKNTRFERYDPFGTMSNSMPVDDSIYEECGSCCGKDFIYLVGGVDKTSDFGHEFAVAHCKAFDTIKRQWSWMKPMSVARRYPASLCLSSRMVIVAGGWTAKSTAGGFDRQQVTRTTEVYDISTMKWKVGPMMLNERYHFAMVEWRGRIIVLGGRGGIYVMEDCECLDLNWAKRDGGWIPFPSMNVKRYGHSAIVMGGDIYVFGGINHKGSVMEVEKYNDVTLAFEIIGKTTIPRFGGICGLLKAKFTQRKRTVSKINL